MQVLPKIPDPKRVLATNQPISVSKSSSSPIWIVVCDFTISPHLGAKGSNNRTRFMHPTSYRSCTRASIVGPKDETATDVWTWLQFLVTLNFSAMDQQFLESSILHAPLQPTPSKHHHASMALAQRWNSHRDPRHYAWTIFTTGRRCRERHGYPPSSYKLQRILWWERVNSSCRGFFNAKAAMENVRTILLWRVGMGLWPVGEYLQPAVGQLRI